MNLELGVAERGDDWWVLGDVEAVERGFVRLIIWSSQNCRRLVDLSAIADDFPIFGCQDARFVGGLKVGLVEAREADMAVVGLQLSVNVFSSVLFIFEVLETLAIIDVEWFKLDHSFVYTNILTSYWDVNSVVNPEIGRVSWDDLSIYGYWLNQLSLVIDE